VIRPALDGGGVEFGARVFGRDGELAAATMVEQIRAWYRDGRGTEPTFAYWPTGSEDLPYPADAAVLVKTHGVLTISWPAKGTTSATADPDLRGHLIL
jgi:protein-L-isoaspartate(D-aspartate) O-methyltransferase